MDQSGSNGAAIVYFILLSALFATVGAGWLSDGSPDHLPLGIALLFVSPLFLIAIGVGYIIDRRRVQVV